MNDQQSYPLSWPAGWKRAPRAETSRFGSHSMAATVADILRQLKNMGVGDWHVVISTNVELRRDGLPYSNQRQPKDTGAAVYFKLKGKPCVLACDKWNLVECNLWAIAKHLEALRGQDRWGVGTLDQAFAGYLALPAPGGVEQWWTVLGVDRDAPFETITNAYRGQARLFHPDTPGGDAARMAAMNQAYAAAKFERGIR